MRPAARGLLLLLIMLVRGAVGYCCTSVVGYASMLRRSSHLPHHQLPLRRRRGPSLSLWTAASSFRADPSTLPRLDLVFDINKTILLEDPAGGKNVRALLNEIVAELAWGHVVTTADGGDRWVSADL